jgi:predicted nuclease of predicted toxin-antitoxin system
LKLLIDFNLSPKLVRVVADLFPGSAHAQTLGFAGETDDEVIWQFAMQNGFALLTADRDFVDLAGRLGHPPKVIRLEKMNYRTRFAADLLQRNAIRIAEFGHGPLSVLVLRYK